MEFLKVIKRRSFLNEVLYVVLNITLAVTLMIIIQATNSMLLAFLLVLLSLWRLFAVRPRFWFAHVQANLVNIIVSASYVVFLYSADNGVNSDAQVLGLRLLFMILYIGWLLLLKPLSKRIYVVAQAAVALVFGITAIYTMAYNWIASPVVLLMWLVGYGAARHTLSTFDEESHTELLSLTWGTLLAELGWLGYHWTIAYRMPLVGGLLLPQMTIVILAIAFVVYKSYDSYYHYGKIRFNDIMLPLIFSVGIISILLLFFNGVSSVV